MVVVGYLFYGRPIQGCLEDALNGEIRKRPIGTR